MKLLRRRSYRRAFFDAAFVAVSLIGATIHCQTANTDDKNSGPGVISGKISTSDGDGLIKARITVGRVSGGVAAPQNVRLDSSGHFETQLLEGGLYFVSVYVPGYITDASQSSTAPPYYRPGDSASFALIKGGVITGSVKNANGDAIVAIPVRAIRVRDQNGKSLQFSGSSREILTDDRGIYRLYGLSPGTYLVSAGGPSRNSFTASFMPGYETYVPTYAPAATRDTAMEVAVNSGDEATADVQFREERGHVISGTIAGATSNEIGFQTFGVGVTVFDVRNRAEVGSASASQTNNFSFALYGVPDGEYELYATQGSNTGDGMMSSAKQIKVQGSDVTGITLSLGPMAAIDGHVNLEPDAKSPCGKRRESAVAQTMVYARRIEAERKAASAQPKEGQAGEVPLVFRNAARIGIVDAKGSFAIKGLQPGNYRIDPREPASGWYVKSIAIAPAARGTNVVRDGVILKSGEHVSGITVTVAEGASQLVGKIALAEGQSLPTNLRVYLVPAEAEAADNLLRFYEARVGADRTFTIDYINPGRYFIVARTPEENEYGIAKPVRFDAAFRANVLRAAQAAKKEVTLKPCEQTFDYQLALTPPTSPQ